MRKVFQVRGWLVTLESHWSVWKELLFPTLTSLGVFSSQTFYVSIVDLCENGGKRPTANNSASFTKEQADTIRRIRNSKDSWDMLGVRPGASR